MFSRFLYITGLWRTYRRTDEHMTTVYTALYTRGKIFVRFVVSRPQVLLDSLINVKFGWKSIPQVYCCMPNFSSIGQGVGMETPIYFKFVQFCGFWPRRGDTTHQSRWRLARKSHHKFNLAYEISLVGGGMQVRQPPKFRIWEVQLFCPFCNGSALRLRFIILLHLADAIFIHSVACRDTNARFIGMVNSANIVNYFT